MRSTSGRGATAQTAAARNRKRPRIRAPERFAPFTLAMLPVLRPVPRASVCADNAQAFRDRRDARQERACGRILVRSHILGCTLRHDPAAAIPTVVTEIDQP